MYVLVPASLPSTREWQDEIERLGLDLRLDGSRELTSASGYWPARSAGMDSGFESYSGSPADILDADLAAEHAIPNATAVAFVTHSDLIELRCALFASAALASMTSGTLIDGESGDVVNPDELIEQARAIGAPSGMYEEVGPCQGS